MSAVAKRILSCAFLSVALCGTLTTFAIASEEGKKDAAPSVTTTVSANPVIEWNRSLLVIVRTPGAQPANIHSTRSFAMLHAAIFDAVNSIEKTYEPYAVHLSHISRGASAEAAADQAAHDLLVSLYPTFAAALDSELQQDLERIRDGRRKEEGIEVGGAVAAEILALRAGDGSSVSLPPFVSTSQPGSYELTPPNFAPADFLQWSRVSPFVIDFASEFRPGPPPDLASDTYTDSFNEVKSLGITGSTTRTADQTQIGEFWNGNIQDFWNEIAQTAALEHHLDLGQTAHLFALMNISVADTVIAFYDAKYTYNLWRPVTAVRQADTDNNPLTVADPNWLVHGHPDARRSDLARAGFDSAGRGRTGQGSHRRDRTGTQQSARQILDRAKFPGDRHSWHQSSHQRVQLPNPRMRAPASRRYRGAVQRCRPE